MTAPSRLLALALCAMGAVFASSNAAAEAALARAPLDLHLGRLLIVLIFCIGLAIAAAVLLKRALKGRARFGVMGFPASSDRSAIAVLETRRLSLHADVCRLAYQDREYLVVVSQGGATLLKESQASASAP